MRRTGFYSLVVCVKSLNDRGTSEWELLTQTTSEYNPIQSTFYKFFWGNHWIPRMAEPENRWQLRAQKVGGGGSINVACSYRRGTLKSNFAVFKKLGWVAVVCHFSSVTVFSVERRNSTACKTEWSHMFQSLKFAHILYNKLRFTDWHISRRK